MMITRRLDPTPDYACFPFSFFIPPLLFLSLLSHPNLSHHSRSNLPPVIPPILNIASSPRHAKSPIVTPLPANTGNTVRDADVLVLNTAPGLDRQSDRPQRVPRGVLGRGKRNSLVDVPAAELGNVADNLDHLAPGSRSALVERDKDLLGVGAAGGNSGDLLDGGVGGGGEVGGEDGRGGEVVVAGNLKLLALSGGEGGGLAGAPAGGDVTVAAGGGGEEGGVGPGEIGGGDGLAGVAVDLLVQGTVGVGVLGGDLDEAVGVGGDGGDDLVVGGGAGGVGADGGARDVVAEERKGGLGDGDGALGLPDEESIVELLGGGKGGEEPGVAVVKDILRVAANSDGLVLGDAAVDVVDGAERVDDDLVVGERPVRAGLESVGIAAGGGVEVVDGGEDRVGVAAAAPLTTVDVGDNETLASVPERLLEAENLRGDGSVSTGGLAEDGAELSTLDEGTVGAGDGKEGGAGNLLPEVETGLVPVLGRVLEIVLDGGPDLGVGNSLVAVLNEPLGVADQGNGTEGRTIALGAAPLAGELLEINHELGLTKTLAVVETTGRVADTLKLGLGGDKVLELGVETLGVVAAEGIGKALVDEGGISGPGVEVCWCLSASASDIREPVNFTVRVGAGRAGNNDTGGNTLVANSTAIGADVAEELLPGDGGLSVDPVVDVALEEVGLTSLDRFGQTHHRLNGAGAQQGELGQGVHGGKVFVETRGVQVQVPGPRVD